MKNTKKNFFIIRYFINDKCIKATFTTKKDANHMMSVGISPTSTSENEAGGITTWFDLDITIRK